MSPKLATRAAIIGFGIAVMLAALAFYETSAPSRDHIVSDRLFLVLCPLSPISMALEKGGVVGELIGWFVIALTNAGLYAAIAWSIGMLIGALRSRKLHGGTTDL